MTNISNIFKKIRKEHDLTQKEFSDLLGVSRSAIAQIESSNNNPSTDLVDKIIEKFNPSEDFIKILTNNVGVIVGDNVGLTTTNNIKKTVFFDKYIEKIKTFLDEAKEEETPGRFLIDSHKELMDLKGKLLIVCSVIHRHSGYSFSKEEIKELNYIDKISDFITDIIFEKKDIDFKDKTMIIRTINNSKELLDKYITEMKYKLDGFLDDFNKLLDEE